MFNACDELGICVWLDFKFACSTYPAFDAAFLENVRQERLYQVKRCAITQHSGMERQQRDHVLQGSGGVDQDKMSNSDYYRLFGDTLGGVMRSLAPQASYSPARPIAATCTSGGLHGGSRLTPIAISTALSASSGFNPSLSLHGGCVHRCAGPRDVYSPMVKYHERSNRMFMEPTEDGTIAPTRS